MRYKYKIYYFKNLYNFFVILSLLIFFFSTTKANGNAFKIENIEISKPFEINFNKNEVLDEGFEKSFLELILLILNSSDQKKIKKTELNEIKGMIDSFSIQEEKFIDETYYVNIGVSFNKKRVFRYLEARNIFPSIPVRKKILFIPVVIDEVKKDLLIFNKNKIFDYWNDTVKNSYQIEYILPTEDLEDLNLVKQRYESIEQYDFKEITNKYNLKDSIIALIFKGNDEVRILSRISIQDNSILKNQSFSKIDIYDDNNVNLIIDSLKISYEDYWKNYNQINTSIKLVLNIRIDSDKNNKISNFEKILDKNDLVYDFFISKFNKEFIYYQITFNGTPNNFLKSMSEKNYNFDTQNKIWLLK